MAKDKKHWLWKPGQSGNPKGRPKGSGKLALMERAKLEAAREMTVSLRAATLLQENSQAVTEEIVRIALSPEKETIRTSEKDGVTTVTITQRPGEAKIRCLIACLERLVPALKSVEVKDKAPTDPKDMSDQQIVDLMTKMVDLAQSGKPPIH